MLEHTNTHMNAISTFQLLAEQKLTFVAIGFTINDIFYAMVQGKRARMKGKEIAKC